MRYLKNVNFLLVITIYVFITINLTILNSTIYTNFINPLFWGEVIIYLIIDRKKNYIRFTKNKRYFKYMIIISCLHVIIYLYLGFVLGFSGRSNNYNFISIFIPVIGIEMARNIIAIRNKNNKLVLIFVTILFILVELKYNILINLCPHKEALFKYICETIFPLIACNSLCMYLTLRSSFDVPLLYRMFNALFMLVLPAIANMDWFIIATMGVLSPTIIYTLFKYKFTNTNENIRKNKKNLYTKLSFTITFIFCINLVFFMIGIFKYEPITILSNSMKPTFERGDVIVFKKMSNSELRQIPINEIVIYSIGQQNVAHRIIDRIEKNDTVIYQTKGDRNNVSDRILIQTDQIKGKYMFHIKYIGFPAVWLYEYFNK